MAFAQMAPVAGDMPVRINEPRQQGGPLAVDTLTGLAGLRFLLGWIKAGHLAALEFQGGKADQLAPIHRVA